MTGILDEYPGAAAAYSLRLLNTDYTGDAVVVRRASDNATQSIGFIDGELDTDTLNTFCSGTDGFVTTWLDQSGNGNNATQTVASTQPKIYDATTGVVLDNGKPSIYFDDNGNSFVSSNLAGKARLDTYFVIDTNDNTYLYPNDTLNANNYGYVAEQGSNGAAVLPEYGSPSLYANSQLFTGTTRNDVYNFLNGSKLVVHQNANTSNWSGYGFGRYSFYNFNGYLSEFIAYNSDQSGNRTGIETNINDFYSIY